MSAILNHLNWRWKGWRHAQLARGILATPPIVPRDDGVVLFSMIGTRVVLPYVVAAKSLHRHLGRGRLVILDDGTLTEADRLTLAGQCGDPEVIALADVDTGRCPRGGTWERLLTILDRRADDYVIQFDSDTVTAGPLPEVAAAIEANRSFSLRGDATVTLMDGAALAASLPPLSAPMHVQQATERLLGTIEVPGLTHPRYFRGCSGFAGFARAPTGRVLAERFSEAVEARLGAARWREWGTEQVTSNFVVANEPDPLLLPYHRYLNYWGETVPADPGLVHFLGTCRYQGTAYLNATREAVRAASAA